jgi:glutaredoxin
VSDRKLICPCYRHEQDIAEMGHCICHLFVDDHYVPPEIPIPPVRKENSPWPYITVYGAYWCKDTLRTVTFLNDADIPYIFVDIDSDQGGAEKVTGWNEGRMSTPTLDIEGKIVHVPSNQELAAILGIEPDQVPT